MDKHNINTIVKWVLIAVLTPFVLILLLAVAIYIPPIQNWAVHKVADYASKETGKEISVEHVCLVFPLDLGVDGIKVIQQNDSLPQVKDTIADIRRLVADVRLWPLLKKNIEIDQFDIYDMKVNTADFIHEARIKGTLGTFMLKSHGIDLGKEFIRLDDVYLADANVDIALSDTVPEDTAKSENFWKINLDRLKVRNCDVALHMPNDTLQIKTHLGDVEATKGYFDLYQGLYKIAKTELKDSRVAYDNVYLARSNILGTKNGGLDVNHIKLDDVNLGIDSLYYCNSDLRLHISHGCLTEQCGIGINSIAADVAMDSTKLNLDADIRTRNVDEAPSSHLLAKVQMDFNAFDEQHPGKVDADVKADVAKSDLLMAMGALPAAFQRQWPDKPLYMNAVAHGNMQHIDIDTLTASLPTAFNIKANGYANNLTNIDALKAKLNIDAHTYNMNFAKAFLDNSTQRMINLPPMHAVATVEANGSQYATTFNVTEGKGRLSGKGQINTKTMAYNASLNANALQLSHFVKGMGLGSFTGTASVKGQGTDYKSAATNLIANAKVTQFQYDRWNLSNVSFDAALRNGHGIVNLISRNELVDGTIALDALMSRNPIRATLTTELNNADLYRMGITDSPLSIAACAHIDVASDLDEYYKVQGLISDLTIRDSAQVYRPDDMVMDILTRRDTTHAVVDCGDFHMNADVKGGYKHLMTITDNIMNEIDRQWKARIISEPELRCVLPEGHVYLSVGQENPISRALSRADYTYYNIYADVTSSPGSGLNGEMHIDTLRTQGYQLDNIGLKLNSTDETIHYDLLVENGKDNPQYSFLAHAKGELLPNGTSLWLGLDDDKGKRGVETSLSAMMEEGGIRLCLDNRDHILGYMPFSVNKDNYVFLANNQRVSADVKLRSADGMGVQIYTDDENVDALQDITVSLHQFDIAKVLSVVPYMPDVRGVLDGDFHAIITPENLSVSSDVGVNNLIYENCPLGNISSEFVYMPQNDGSHHIDGILFKEGQEIATVIGDYNPEGNGNINADVTMTAFPLDFVNGFIPDQLIGLSGIGEGNINVKGALNAPDVNGEVFLQDAALISVPYGVNMRFDDDPVRIIGSRLLFENFQMYANNDQPLVCYGYLDFSNLDHMNMDLKMRARNFQLVDAKETRRSEAYGKAFVNFDATMKGELSQLKVNGNIDVLSTTDLYYILRDSPITTDNRLKELVTFTDLNADEPLMVNKPTVDGLRVNMSVNVADGTHLKCWLNTNHTNYLDILAGGNLRMTMSGDDMSMVGRCTIAEGEMKYSLPVIPLKTFKIEEGSYIEFTGDVMNPRLSISAAEENKTTVNVGGTNQTVLFNCGVKISKTLNDMGLEFTIDAPENQTISDELKTMSLEERGKLAVTMLTTGMYLTDNNTSNFTMNSALSSFLQQEINQIAGNALRTLDLSVGLENSTDASGQMHTDYSFKFAKRFWNNRLAISVGGKISTGPDVSNQNQSFFDNVQVQYRLSDTSNQYLQLFYNRAVYDYLEGYLGEYGAGYMWKRKLQNFRDIFQFGDDDLSKKHREPADTIKTK